MDKPRHLTLDRRQFIKTASLGLVGLTIAPRLAKAAEFLGVRISQVPRFELVADEAMVQMVDGTWVYMWTWADESDATPRFPGPLLVVGEGEEVEVSVRNVLDEPHSFTIPGVVDSGPILPGEVAELSFSAPPAGIYAYYDSLRAPVNRLLGLHGAFMVMPPAGSLTPYSSPPDRVRRLFEDFGTTPHFPGEPWHHDRTWVWVLANIDPAYNAVAESGAQIAPAQMETRFLGRYFTMNGKSGFFSSHDHSTMLMGRIGEPALVRVINFGVHPHFPHAHGNHTYVIARNGVVGPHAFTVDTVAIESMDTVDFMFPFMRPEDIPSSAWPPQEEAFPFKYPVHCHNEPSQTAGGSNYPQGMVTDVVFTGDLQTSSVMSEGGQS